MPYKSAKKIAGVQYAIRNIVQKAKELEEKGQQILYLNIGDPLQYDFTTPPAMIEAAYQSMIQGKSNAYAPSYGEKEASKCVLNDEKSKGKSNLFIDDIILTTGASEGIELAMTALFNPGENILVPSPGYPLYTAVASKLEIGKNHYNLNTSNWELDIEDISSKINDKTRAIVIINPNNPTGKIYSKETLTALTEVAEKHQLIIFSDEIYDRLTFKKEIIYPANLTTKVPVISFNGLAKSYLVPGWRVGWLSCSNSNLCPEYLAAIKKLADARLCSPSPQQFAIKPALEGDQDHIQETLSKLKRRRDLCVERLNSIEGMTVIEPDGAFYLMAQYNLPDGMTDEQFVLKLLASTGVLVVHGSGFGMDPLAGCFRLVYLPDETTLKAALDKIQSFCATI